jgi:hypothetical protein
MSDHLFQTGRIKSGQSRENLEVGNPVYYIYINTEHTLILYYLLFIYEY